MLHVTCDGIQQSQNGVWSSLIKKLNSELTLFEFSDFLEVQKIMEVTLIVYLQYSVSYMKSGNQCTGTQY